MLIVLLLSFFLIINYSCLLVDNKRMNKPNRLACMHAFAYTYTYNEQEEIENQSDTL